MYDGFPPTTAVSSCLLVFLALEAAEAVEGRSFCSFDCFSLLFTARNLSKLSILAQDRRSGSKVVSILPLKSS